MKNLSLGRWFVLPAALLLAAGTVLITGCQSANPSYIEPTVQPGGFQTPGVRFHPPGGGVVNLPEGFKACGSFSAKVTLSDGTTVLLSGCIYCSTNPNNREVYVQHNCTGEYRKGIREPGPQRNATPAQPKQTSSLGGNLGPEKSELKFTVDEEFKLVDAMIQCKEYGVELLIDEVPVDVWYELGVTTFEPGRYVRISGENEALASTMFWSFGTDRLRGETDSGDTIDVMVGRVEGMNATDDFSLLIISKVNDETKQINHVWFPKQ